jgi:DNA-binding PadR family transcriptional regulator
MTTPQLDDFVPLSPRVFHILLALAEGTCHGYRLMLSVEANSQGRVRIGPGTLYEALHRLCEQGLIDEVEEGKRPKTDGRRQRYYRLARLGKRVLRAEAERLAGDLQVARAHNLLGEERSS